ncbi:MAG: Crp/Fnr family transcriptional regulator [Deltaproteobacteria bacterium]|nr:MAG: Crp/Fnr family transcriptional regulator [Deltaproteobacteria bacterium]
MAEERKQRWAQLRKVLQQMMEVPDKEWLVFADLFQLRTFAKNDYLLRAGETSDPCFFLCEGVVRFYYLTPDGKEFNKSFLQAHQFAASLSTSLLQTPARFSMQALEDVVALEASLSSLRDLFPRHICWERLGRTMAEQLAIKKELRECSFLLDSAEERYLNFLRDYPGLEDKITQYHVASYLGITNVALSRIRRRIRDNEEAS